MTICPCAASLACVRASPLKWACSSVVEHCVDIAGVASSILATPTIKSPGKHNVFQGFFALSPLTWSTNSAHDSARFDQKFPFHLGTLWACVLVAQPRGSLYLCKWRCSSVRVQWPACRRVGSYHARTLGHRQALGRGSARDDLWCLAVAVKSDPVCVDGHPANGAAFSETSEALHEAPTNESVPADIVGVEPGGLDRVSTEIRSMLVGKVNKRASRAQAVARDPPALPAAEDVASARFSLLTPQDIIQRLRVDVVDADRWVRRLCKQHAVALTRVRGRLRLSEAQFRHLLDKMQCSPLDSGESPATGIAGVRSRSTAARSTSQNSIRERVTRLLQSTPEGKKSAR